MEWLFSMVKFLIQQGFDDGLAKMLLHDCPRSSHPNRSMFSALNKDIAVLHGLGLELSSLALVKSPST